MVFIWRNRKRGLYILCGQPLHATNNYSLHVLVVLEFCEHTINLLLRLQGFLWRQLLCTEVVQIGRFPIQT